MLHCWSTRDGFQMFKAPATWIQMEVTTTLLPGHLLQVFVRQWQKERSWSPILTKHIDIATGAAKKKVVGTRPSMGGNPFRGQPGALSGVSHTFVHFFLGAASLKPSIQLMAQKSWAKFS